MKILGIETSCDETAIALVQDKTVLSNIISSQGSLHAPYGGVVPEIASRSHVEVLPRLLESALKEANLPLSEIDGIAATATPGLLGSLLVGLQFGKGLSLALNKPFIGVNHLEGHLNSVFLENNPPAYPYLGLIVSGGHTHLYLVEDFGRYRLLGATRDDAAGEAFDKVAKLLKLGYPGGPILDRISREGNPEAFRFTSPKMGRDSLDFSFSGIKTAVLLKVKEQNGHLGQQFVADLAASFQECVTRVLIERLDQGARRYPVKNIALVGGVAANKTLRKKLHSLSLERGYRYCVPAVPLCTDNGAMIAYVGMEHLKRGKSSPMSLNASAGFVTL